MCKQAYSVCDMSFEREYGSLSQQNIQLLLSHVHVQVSMLVQ